MNVKDLLKTFFVITTPEIVFINEMKEDIKEFVCDCKNIFEVGRNKKDINKKEKESEH